MKAVIRRWFWGQSWYPRVLQIWFISTAVLIFVSSGNAESLFTPRSHGLLATLPLLLNIYAPMFVLIAVLGVLVSTLISKIRATEVFSVKSHLKSLDYRPIVPGIVIFLAFFQVAKWNNDHRAYLSQQTGDRILARITNFERQKGRLPKSLVELFGEEKLPQPALEDADFYYSDTTISFDVSPSWKCSRSLKDDDWLCKSDPFELLVRYSGS